MKKLIAALLLAAMLFALTGCFTQPLGDLYALPAQAEDYYNLQQAIDEVMNDSAYAAPVTGDNRQAVQLRDLDGDGKNEAILFSRTESEHPLKIYIFHRNGNLFSRIACLEGDGISFDCVQYVQLDGQGGPELLVGRQLSDEVLQTINVYTISSDGATELLYGNYSEFFTADLNNDERSELLLFRMESQERNGLVEMYGWQENALQCEQRSELSVSAENIRRLVSGKLAGGTPAVFVSSLLDESSYITDVFAIRSGKLSNLTKQAGEEALFTVEKTAVFASDIDSDGEIELPKVLRQAGQNTSLIEWCSLSVNGTAETKLLTCQNGYDRWYVELLQRWQKSLQIEEHTVDGLGRTTVFSARTASGIRELFTVYALTGEDRAAEAEADGRFLLGSKADVTFAASIGEAGLADNLNAEDLQAWFHLIPDPTNNET